MKPVKKRNTAVSSMPWLLASALSITMALSACDASSNSTPNPAAPSAAPSSAPSEPANPDASGETPAFATVQSIVENRCFRCHGNGNRSGGVNYDDPADIVGRADRIHVRVVEQKNMPQANVTGMTDDERATIDAWFTAGAPGP